MGAFIWQQTAVLEASGTAFFVVRWGYLASVVRGA